MDAARDLVNLEDADQRSDKLLQLYKRDPSLLSQDDKVELAAYLQVYAFERLDAVRKLDAQNGLGISHSLATVQASVASLLSGEQALGYGYPYAGSSQDKLAWADAQRSQMGLVENLAWTRDRSVDEQTYLDAKSSLRIGEQQQGLANLGDPAIYFLTGSIGSTIRAVAATNGALQFTQGAKQAVDGDGWNAAGNMVAGLLGMATLGIPAVKGGAVAIGDAASTRPGNPGVIRNDPALAVSPNTGKYLEDFKPSPTPLELVRQQTETLYATAFIRFDHILDGGVNTLRSGERVGTGGHYLRSPDVNVTRITGQVDEFGVSKGYVSIRDPLTNSWAPKKAETTFFPEQWSKRQVQVEIEGAFRNSSPIAGTERWRGISPSGVRIEGYYGKPDGTGATAWPVYGKDRKI
ncbi:EndoU domain-containing protein [Pseudomonas sp. MH2]|uniref:EndoU domain-containing protein n=1 Tax=Pseudomonas machongensis TaxID=3110229 RepID=A0ABU5VQL8_9PSED|nr:EndoU domain-containing protein [Pseudomonas sp. MH2]MEA5674295.1 EndoU domain-containing protein [Pseudomonas sp. MH2]